MTLVTTSMSIIVIRAILVNETWVVTVEETLDYVKEILAVVEGETWMHVMETLVTAVLPDAVKEAMMGVTSNQLVVGSHRDFPPNTLLV